MIDPCVFKTLVLSSPQTLSPVSAGLLSSMNALWMLLLSLEALTVLDLSFTLKQSIISYSCLFICVDHFLASISLIRVLLPSLSPLLSTLHQKICRGHSKNHHESHGCEGSYPLPPQKPSSGSNRTFFHASFAFVLTPLRHFRCSVGLISFFLFLLSLIFLSLTFLFF